MNEAPTADGGPGFLAFLAFFLLALALWFLMRNMNARMRRMSYRQQAAHRGKDDPQVAPGDLLTEAPGPGPVPGAGESAEGEADPGPGDAVDDADHGDDPDGTPADGEKGPGEGR